MAEWEFRLPDVGEGLTEAEVVRWLVEVGQEIAVNQHVVEVETAKALVELPAPHAGVVTGIRVQPGALVPVGTVLYTAVSDSDSRAEPTREAVLVGYGVQESHAGRRRGRRSTTSFATPSVAAAEIRATTVIEVRALAAPPVRKLAKDLGIDLSAVRPTGSRGEVTRADVLAAQAPRAAGSRTPVHGVRRAIAKAMVTSAFTAPHVTEWLDVEVSAAIRRIDQLRADGQRVTMLTLVCEALLAALRDYPGVNARWEDLPGGEAEIVVLDDVNLGIAADTPRGLMVPTIKRADAMGFAELADALSELIDRARTGAVTPVDLTGGTITITNVGVFGVDGGTPILNPGESAILAMGRVISRPWVVDGEIVARPVMELTMSFDHRVIDGALGSRFLAAVAARLSEG